MLGDFVVFNKIFLLLNKYEKGSVNIWWNIYIIFFMFV